MALNFFITFSLLFVSSTFCALSTVNGEAYYVYAPPPPPKVNDVPKPKVYVPYNSMGVQGGIFYRSEAKFIPLQGAIARVTCLAIDKYGYKPAPITILSSPTDKNGYYLAKLPLSQVHSNYKLTKCKAFLHSSPSSTYNVPTNINKGKTGAAITPSSCKLIPHHKMNLCSVPPFIYTSNPINGGY